MAFGQTQKATSQIPVASMADIAFLLLIFFISTTIFRMEEGLPVALPRAETAQRQERELIMHVWIDKQGHIAINDRVVAVEDISGVVMKVLQEKPGLIVAFNADERCPYSVVSDVMEELKKANAVRVSFTSEPEAAANAAADANAE